MENEKMMEYPKITSAYERDEKTFKFTDKFRTPEIEYLSSATWSWTEKMHGTNIRVFWDAEKKQVRFGGRTEDAQIPTFLYTKLQEIFTVELFEPKFDNSVMLFGEGYGAKINSGGLYIPDGVDFMLFDVMIGGWWMRRESLSDISQVLKVGLVPETMCGTIDQAANFVRGGFASAVGTAKAEGLVGKPLVQLNNRQGKRIIIKIKTKDFA